MSHGSIAQIGTPEALYRAPASPFVARFVGDAMSLVGRICGGALHLEGGVLPLDVADGGSAYVRAEDVKLDEDGPLTGQIASVTFLGTHYRIVLSGITPEPLALLHVGASAPKVGARVRLSIAPGAILTFGPGLEDA
jgi:putative spermidine/putrescine transport system ATP-binding protein